LTQEKVWIVPCSGIGKTYGSVARECAFIVTEDLSPQKTRIMALSRLVSDDADIGSEIKRVNCIAIDGCKLSCSAKVVAAAGGTVTHSLQVLDAFREHPDLKPEGIAELNEGGHGLATVLAEKVSALVDGMEEKDNA
jgi:uncharacterized metal-binding protein